MSALSPAAKRALERRALEGVWSVRALLRVLRELEEWDRMIPVRRKKAEWLLALGCMASILGLILLVMFAAFEDRWELGLAAFAAPVGLTVVCWKWLERLRAADLPDELWKTLRPVLRALQQDLDGEKKIKCSINLVVFEENRYKLKKDLPPTARWKMKLSVFEQPFCDVRLPLADGSTAVLRIRNRIRRVEKYSNSRRRVFKVKKKWKKLSKVTAMLIPAEKGKWKVGHLDKKRERLKFVERKGVTVARMDRRQKMQCIGDAPEGAVRGADVVGMFVRLAGMRP